MAVGAFLVSGLLIACVGALVQPAANTYLKSKHPDAGHVGMTWGEMAAAVLGIAVLALVALVLFGTASSSKSSATNPGTSQIPRVAPVLSQLRPIALRTGPNSALDITYSPSSYGLAMSRSAIAIIRWNRNGTYRLVLSRRQPARAR